MQAVEKIIDKAVAEGYQTAGICTMLYSKKAFASSTGNLVAHDFTSASLSFTMDKGLASSYISLSGSAWDEIEVDDAVEKVAHQTKINEGAVDIEPGDYKLIFEPEATWNLLMFFPWIMNARDADEGTSVFSGMEGKKVAGEEFTLTSSLFGSRPADAGILTASIRSDRPSPAAERVHAGRGVGERHSQQTPLRRFGPARPGHGLDRPAGVRQGPVRAGIVD